MKRICSLLPRRSAKSSCYIWIHYYYTMVRLKTMYSSSRNPGHSSLLSNASFLAGAVTSRHHSRSRWPTWMLTHPQILSSEGMRLRCITTSTSNRTAILRTSGQRTSCTCGTGRQRKGARHGCYGRSRRGAERQRI